MSGRGRGRGRGAFGRGAGGPPEIKDEDGQYVTRDVAGPPPLYPEVVEVERKDPSREATDLKIKWRALTSYWKKSAYHMKLLETRSGSKRSLAAFLEDSAPKDSLDTSQLAKVLTLHPKYFPEELYTSQEKRVSNKAASSDAQKQYWAAMSRSLKSPEGDGFERLAKLEAQREEDTVLINPDQVVIKTDEAEEEAEEEVEDDEPNEDEFEDDDYLQGQEYDDDEGYEDNFGDDDDGGGGAYY